MTTSSAPLRSIAPFPLAITFEPRLVDNLAPISALWLAAIVVPPTCLILGMLWTLAWWTKLRRLRRDARATPSESVSRIGSNYATAAVGNGSNRRFGVLPFTTTSRSSARSPHLRVMIPPRRNASSSTPIKAVEVTNSAPNLHQARSYKISTTQDGHRVLARRRRSVDGLSNTSISSPAHQRPSSSGHNEYDKRLSSYSAQHGLSDWTGPSSATRLSWRVEDDRTQDNRNGSITRESFGRLPKDSSSIVRKSSARASIDMEVKVV